MRGAHHRAPVFLSKPEMKLLVLAQTPPPLHGQSAMVRTLVDGLPARGIAVVHVNLALSTDAADIGRWRPAKILRTAAAAVRAIAARFRHSCDTLYYVPAPPKRGALYRDWLVLALCRPFFRRTVLHWHAVGLGAWLPAHATAAERRLSRALLGRAHLALVLADTLRGDAEYFQPRRCAVVPNGIPDPGPPPPPPPPPPAPPPSCALFFLGLGSAEKGLFAAAAAVLAANARLAAPSPAGAATSPPAFTLTAAGPFPDAATAARFAALCAAHPGVLRHVGSLDAAGKRLHFAASHALLLPTHYPAEGLPLVALEALAHDRPVIATRWRGLPDIVTTDVGQLVAPGDPAALADALVRFRSAPPPAGVCRARYLRHFTVDAHLEALAAALRSVDPR
jgi:glycosyltransferase involved in cell wall biosynthesis